MIQSRSDRDMTWITGNQNATKNHTLHIQLVNYVDSQQSVGCNFTQDTFL